MIPQSRHSITREDIKFVGKALAGDFLTRGPLTLEFEAKIAELCGKKYCVTMANGTVALHAALLACNAKHVVSPTLTFSAIANATHFAGAKLYLTDVDSYKLHATTYSQPLPAKGLVFVPMDYAGLPYNLDSSGLGAGYTTVIRDACHSFGATVNGESHVRHDDMAVFSFHPIKTIACGEGGCIVADSEEYATELRRIRNNGLENHQQHRFGLNYHMSEIEVALGLSQLKRLDKILERRRELASKYIEHWAGQYDRITLPADDNGHAYHLFVIRLADSVKIKRDTFRRELADMGIGTQVNYRPLHRQPIVASVIDSTLTEFPNADWAWERMLSIPLYYGLTDNEQKVVMKAIDRLLDKHAK